MLDHEFPGSRFILTLRDSAEEWYRSLTQFHTNLIGKGRLPTAEDLKEFYYRRKGFLWRSHELVYGIDESSLYRESVYIGHYERHSERVLDYFARRENDLLVLNVASTGAMKKLCDFLDIQFTGQVMPHLNKSTSS